MPDGGMKSVLSDGPFWQEKSFYLTGEKAFI
jgi:hypothetical protein